MAIFSLVSVSAYGSDNRLSRTAWVEKVYRTLLGGEEIRPGDELEKLSQKSEDQIIEYLMKDPRFVETVLDFNLYFLGLKSDPVVSQYRGKGKERTVTYSPHIYYSSQAIQSVRNLMKNGDYLALFDYDVPYYVGPMKKIAERPTKDGSTEKVPPEEVKDYRRRVKANLVAQLDGIIAEIKEKGDDIDKVKVCQELIHLKDLQVLTLGIPSYLSHALPLFGFDTCYQNHKAEHILGIAKMYRYKAELIYDQLDALDEDSYQVRTLLDLKAFDFGKFRDAKGPLTAPMWRNLPVSVTNMSWGRSAYFLSTYYCDDLVPVEVTIKDWDKDNRHGYLQKCMNCHYKLNPISGFFRYYGKFGVKAPYSTKHVTPFKSNKEEYYENVIVFDDRARKPLRNQEAIWTRSDGSLNVGVARSHLYPKINDKGESLEDLFRIMKQSPEVRNCLVKKMAKYFVGSEQQFDQGYLTDLRVRFDQQAKTNSSEAFRSTVKALLKSNTFRQGQLDSNTCYDLASGEMRGDRPPCEVAEILEQNCAQCHSSTKSQQKLDITKWIKIGDGFGFPHLDQAGNQLSHYDSMKRFEKEMFTLRPNYQLMHREEYLSSYDREKVFVWVQNSLAKAAH